MLATFTYPRPSQHSSPNRAPRSCATSSPPRSAQYRGGSGFAARAVQKQARSLSLNPIRIVSAMGRLYGEVVMRGLGGSGGAFHTRRARPAPAVGAHQPLVVVAPVRRRVDDDTVDNNLRDGGHRRR